MQTKEQSSGVTFRLDQKYRERLDAQAEKAGLSTGQYARLLVVSALDNTAVDDLRVEVLAAKAQMESLRKDLSNVAFALLVKAGGVKQEEAKQWIERYLHK